MKLPDKDHTLAVMEGLCREARTSSPAAQLILIGAVELLATKFNAQVMIERQVRAGARSLSTAVPDASRKLVRQVERELVAPRSASRKPQREPATIAKNVAARIRSGRSGK